MKALLYPFVAVAGALTSVESGANAALAKTLGGPWWAAILFSAICTVLLGTAALVLGGPVPWGRMHDIPWWGWSGGGIGAVYVISMLIGPGQLGAGLFTGLTVTAAVIASITLDNWGLVGFAQHPASIGRLLGAGLMVVGLGLVAAF